MSPEVVFTTTKIMAEPDIQFPGDRDEPVIPDGQVQAGQDPAVDQPPPPVAAPPAPPPVALHDASSDEMEVHYCLFLFSSCIKCLIRDIREYSVIVCLL